jgi:hypothetical protein
MPEREYTRPERKPNVTATQGHRRGSGISASPMAGPIYSTWIFYLPPGNGTWYQGITFDPGIVNPYTPVFASICETQPGPEGVPTPHDGAATMRINNVVPKEDEVVLLIEIDWQWPLTYQVALAIGPESGIV